MYNTVNIMFIYMYKFQSGLVLYFHDVNIHVKYIQFTVAFLPDLAYNGINNNNWRYNYD